MKKLPGDANEGDVETQVIYPLLTDLNFLRIPIEDVRSKMGISARDIGKGSKKKIGYVPDFCIFKQSLPVMVVEAKSPNYDVATAYNEARMYALELNRSFPTNVNPCARVIATNGNKLLVGFWDSDPAVSACISDVEQGSAVFDEIAAIVGNEALTKLALPISQALKSKTFKRPFNDGAGPALISSHIEPNTFAADLSPALRRYFSSRDQTTDREIYQKAYISSNEVTAYDKILESFLKDRLAKSTKRIQIKTTKRKSDAISKALTEYDSAKMGSGDIQLITGGVGTGKSLFARRYKEFLQPEVLAAKTHWAFLNFNNAPKDQDWNNWVCEQFAQSLIEEGAPIDLRSADDQERVFASDLADRNAFYERMEQGGVGRGILERARDLEQWRQDPLKLARGLSRYLQGDKAENIVVVFDNVDRRDSESQLAAFQTALWFADQTRCLLMLQLRDSTFEAFKNEPPLDTYKTGQIFHISPPRFIDVVKRRLELCIDHLAEEAPDRISFRTSTGVLISYPKNRAGDFLRALYDGLFHSRSNIARVLESLAGRNVRRALDMFMAIITSGHIPEEVIASVAQGQGVGHFPEYKILRALMRQDYRFFNDNSGFVANIFYCQNSWERPSNLIVPEILFYLIGQRKIRGDNGQIGFVALARLSEYLENMGFVRSDIREAVYFCLQKELIEVETASPDFVGERESIKATASGWAHIRLLCERFEYIASVLPTTPCDDKKLREQIFDVMQTEARTGHPSFQRSMNVVSAFERYLSNQIEQLEGFPGFPKAHQTGSRYVLEKVRSALNHARRETGSVTGQADLLDF